MPLIANNIIIKNGESEQVIQTSDSPKTSESEINSLDHHILIVDGKSKKVSKRSHYLLDMLTIEEE